MNIILKLTILVLLIAIGFTFYGLANMLTYEATLFLFAFVGLPITFALSATYLVYYFTSLEVENEYE